MTEAERATLKNQIAIMRMSREEHANTALGRELRRRIASTQVLLFRPGNFCRCGSVARGDLLHTIDTSHGGKFVCDLCDCEVPRSKCCNQWGSETCVWPRCDCPKRPSPSTPADMLEQAALLAEMGCLVPPDGGSPTEAERQMCDNIAKRIRALKP